jgi:metal-responsive CopG/Arc/MetJ family transcriptional regulator
MKTAVSLPDDLFADAEALAEAQGMTRSGLYSAALREYLARHRPDAVTLALDAVYASEPSALDPALAAAAARTLQRNEW